MGFEIEREQARSTLEQKNDRLEEFAEVLGHDLRNPLNVAEGRLELIRDEHESEHLDAVADAHDRMEALIEDLLTRARQQEDNIETEPVSLSNASKSCWKYFNTGDAELVCETDKTVKANPSRLKELLENLLRNSLEHAGDDVTIEIGSLPDGFYFEDDGTGIPEEQREEVLEPLHTTTDDGTGLGLSIVSDIADSHGWTLSITDSKHGGARFEFTALLD
ncbi:sensor histidine kinase [Halorussus marinus]|uniref:sensor histidine kinase n=1 Tax=Halorussus marinus TaxID=2505976 RepID=UPI002453610A|nr:HAMP domain-containing sensor histidine kinase [Halorussus marinus]